MFRPQPRGSATHATIFFASLLARHEVPVHPPFAHQHLKSSLARKNMLPQLGVVALSAKTWMLH